MVLKKKTHIEPAWRAAWVETRAQPRTEVTPLPPAAVGPVLVPFSQWSALTPPGNHLPLCSTLLPPPALTHSLMKAKWDLGGSRLCSSDRSSLPMWAPHPGFSQKKSPGSPGRPAGVCCHSERQVAHQSAPRSLQSPP